MKNVFISGFVLLNLFLFSDLPAQDEFRQTGDFFPNIFSELVDVESFSPDTIYTFGVGGLMFVDISDPYSPEMIGIYNPGSILKRFYTAHVQNDLAVGAARLDGLYIIDVSDITNPDLIKIFNANNLAYESVVLNLPFAYLAAHDVGVEIIDLSNPGEPSSIGFKSEVTNGWDVFIDGNYLYVADGPNGLKIFSIEDPADPLFLSAIATSGYCKEVIVKNGNAYLALGASGFDIIDVTDPSNPRFISNFGQLFGILNHLDVFGNVLFTANWELVYAIDVSNPVTPKIIATEDTPVRAMGIGLQENLVFIADWSTVRVYDFLESATPDIHVKPTVHDFGFNDSSSPLTKEFTIYNLGEGNLVVDSIRIDEFGYDDPDNYLSAFSAFPTSFVIEEHGFKRFTVTFKPPLKATPNTTFPGNLKLFSNDADEAVMRIDLFGGGSRPPDGSIAPEFTLEDLNGNSHSLSDFRGKVVVMALFASW